MLNLQVDLDCAAIRGTDLRCLPTVLENVQIPPASDLDLILSKVDIRLRRRRLGSAWLILSGNHVQIQ
jgi:hypothetical protein